MFKHKCNQNVILDGKTYKPVQGIVELPIKMDKLNPVKEVKEEPKENEKDLLVKKAHELGLGSPSTLKRLSEETLKERIEEAN